MLVTYKLVYAILIYMMGGDIGSGDNQQDKQCSIKGFFGCENRTAEYTALLAYHHLYDQDYS